MPQLAELRRAIDELALNMVVSPSEVGMEPAGWTPAVQRIREMALAENAGQVAASAGSMIGSLSRLSALSGGSSERIAAELAQGIARLQQALDADRQADAPVPEAAAPAPLSQDPELLADFVLESREHLAAVEAQVLAVERDPADKEALNAVFRGFHTIKGLAGFLELREVQGLAHEVETILDRARNSQLTITASAIDVVLQSADHLRGWLNHVESQLRHLASDPPERDESLLGRIRALASGAVEPECSPEPGAGELAALAAAVESGKPEEPAASRPREAMAVKVDTAKLDYMVDMAGEMLIAESLVRHDPDLSAIKSPKLQRKVAQLKRITAELQKTAMAMRLVPIGPLFGRMARLVRDLSRQFGKPVEMETLGGEIELDRNIVEELADPLMHMVRNALDHGIEPPEERRRKEKSAVARLLLKAHHQAGQVVIEMADDGRGLDPDKIKAKALEKGLITAAEALSEAEIYNLIFLPGFTTAKQVTSISGRGVGMDVVRGHIEKLRGRVEIRSAPGRGTAFVLKLPLTLAIIDGLVVGVGQERYIVPLFGVREMFRPTREHLWTVQQRAEMALVRNTLLPVLRLYRRFRVRPRSEDPLESVLVVAEVEGQRFCLLVDELVGKQEVVITSLGETFQNVPGVAGGAILGDGKVGLILDLERLFKGQDP